MSEEIKNNEAGNLSVKKTTKIIAVVLALILAVIIGIFIFLNSSSNNIEGTWHNDDEGNVTFGSDGILFWNGESDGTWEVSGNELTMYYDSVKVQVFSYDIDRDTLIITKDGESWICSRVN